jgi:hypothetical protein
MNIHPDITAERVIDAVKRHNATLDDPGFCVCCGADADGVEPDARDYPCEICGENGVYGADELLIMMA